MRWRARMVFTGSPLMMSVIGTAPGGPWYWVIVIVPLFVT